MICRLCLTNLELEHAILLFESTANETKLVKLIAKFFYLEITQNDPISTKICQKCRDHLEEFYVFWTYVDKKQSILREEHVSVKLGLESEPCIESANIVTNKQRKIDDSQNEMLLDIKNLQMPHEICCNESILQNPEVNNSMFVEDINALDIASDTNKDAYSTDDDVPLLKLKTTVKKKRRRNKDSISKINSASKKTKTQQNIEIVDNAMDLSCDLCKVSVEGYAQLRSHFLEKHDCAPYVKCCNRRFTQPSKLIQHINWHNSLFKCDICGKELRSTNRLIAHKESFHSIKSEETLNYNCRVCNKGFANEASLENHIPACSEDVFSCLICKKEYNSKKWLQNHIKKDHGSEEKNFACQSCGKMFLTVQRMQRHIEAIHEKLYNHICDVCGKKFRSKPSFEKHVLEHQGIVEPTAQCNLCGEWVKNAQVLRLHQFSHDTVNVECKYCGKKCVSRSALSRHIKYAHKLKKDLQCKFCDKTFKETRNLNEHMAIHTGVQLYSCPHCSKECRSRSNMYVHIKRNHLQEWLKSRAERSHDPNINSKLGNQPYTVS